DKCDAARNNTTLRRFFPMPGALGYRGWRPRLQPAPDGDGVLLRVEAVGRDGIEIGAGDAHEARAVGEVDRVDVALLELARHAGGEAEGTFRHHVGESRLRSVVAPLPDRHVRPARSLAINRPGAAVVVRRPL